MVRDLRAGGRSSALARLGWLSPARSAAGALALIVAASAGCTSPPHAWAGQVISKGQLIGGPRAAGEIGDWRLSNGRVRFIVQDIHSQRVYGTFGGSLLDADLARGDETADPRTQLNGQDGLGELFPAFFLSALEPTDIQLLDDGSSGGTARLRIYGKQSEFITATRLLDSAILGSGLEYILDYALGPDDDFLQITASISNPAASPVTFANSQFPLPVGFIGLFGADQQVFIPGEAGYDVRFALEKAYGRNYTLPAIAGLTANAVAVEGGAVSYGLSYCSSCGSPLPQGITASAGFVSNHQDQYSPWAPVTSDTMQVPFISGSLFGLFMGEVPQQLPGGAAFSTTMRLRVGAPGAAPQLDAVQRDEGVETGTVAGYVREQVTQTPLAGARVVVFQGGEVDPQTGRPSGLAATSATSDAGGRFHANLPAGHYTAIATNLPDVNSPPIQFDIELNQVTEVDPEPGRAAVLAIEIVDENGRRVPAKATLDASYDAQYTGVDPKLFLYDLRLGDPYRPTDLTPDSAADPETRRYLETTLRAVDGRIESGIRPGHYRLTVSRGPAYSIFQQEIDLVAGQATRVYATVKRLLPANGRVAADLHVHAVGSVDADVSLDDRMLGYAAEGIEFLAITEHNYIEDVRPNIQNLGLSDFLQATSGLELSSIEAGHWNAYPLRYDPAAATHGAMSWFRRNPQDLFDSMRALGVNGAADTVVEVNHPRDSIQGYLSSYGFTGDPLTGDPAHDWPGKSGVFAPSGPGFGPGTFSLDFDAIELLTGKRFDVLRTYRVPDPPPPSPPAPMPCSAQTVPQPGCMGPPGSIVRDTSGMVAFPGALEDWEHLLDSGRRFTAMSNSDSHDLLNGEGGYPRNLIDIGHGWSTARDIDEVEVARAIKAGRVLLTDGPEIQLTALDPTRTGPDGLPLVVPIGGLVTPDASGGVTVHVVVSAAPWIDVQRVSLLVGGACDESMGDCHLQPLSFEPGAVPPGSVLRLDQTVRVSIQPGADSWIAATVDGDRSLWPVLIPLEVPPLLLNDAISSLSAAFSSFGFGDPYGGLQPSQIRQIKPWALTNPILIDGNGDGHFGTLAPRRAEQLPRAAVDPNQGIGDSARLIDLRAVLHLKQPAEPTTQQRSVR